MLFSSQTIIRGTIFLVLFASSFLFLNTTGKAQKTTLILHHFLSSQSITHSQMLVPWAKRLEKESNGEIEVKIFPSMSLGGKPADLYRQVRDGTVDIIWTVLGYTPGVFQRSEVFELPTVHRGSAYATNMAIEDMMDDIKQDYKDLTPLLIHVHDGNALFMANQSINAITDMKGLKIRTPSRTGSWLLKSLQAEPVGMPVPTLPQALAKTVVEGALIPFEISVPLKLYDITQYSVIKDQGERFGTSVFMFAMNTEKYNSLSPRIRRIIDQISGRDFSHDMAQLWRKHEKIGMTKQRESGGQIITLNKEITAQFNSNHQEVVNQWIAEMESHGIDGKSLVKKARERIKHYQQM